MNQAGQGRHSFVQPQRFNRFSLTSSSEESSSGNDSSDGMQSRLQ